MTAFGRYAIYYTAPPGPLAQFGADWLGWDLRAGREVAHPQLCDLPSDQIAALTETPRRYGFHATLKPPFRLAPGSDQAALLADLAAHCRGLSPVTLAGGLQLATLDGFLALIPAQPSEALQSLAAGLVRDLDHHRAPLTEAEIARRRPERLTDAQRARLLQWGYPWVIEGFRFHMTLTGRLPQAETRALHAILQPQLAPILPDPMVLDAVSLCGEDDRGRFHEIERIAF
ncbi:DUF1045 domain-containing protein [Paracoccus tegillarcae]|uniref:Phosphonate metabolism protein n=1 Tax=Paracoccus tegillarcae TaxID=1529068 RepID=A0A2K9EK35_9RHOB|nr:DUF1045 domain-containing protein [Paracoccus tegillarcae]AUH35393.1 phosphonate metabolism protein [Paracoccus tegillarcae]